MLAPALPEAPFSYLSILVHNGVMGLEYKQQRYRAAEGRFDGNLNAMAREGWKVESIDRIEELFLVTYSRQSQPKLKVDQCLQSNLEHVIGVNLKAGNLLKEMVGAIQPGNDFIYTLIWEVTRPGEQVVFDTVAKG